MPNVSRDLCRKLHKLLSYRIEANPPKTLLPLMLCLDELLRLVPLVFAHLALNLAENLLST